MHQRRQATRRQRLASQLCVPRLWTRAGTTGGRLHADNVLPASCVYRVSGLGPAQQAQRDVRYTLVWL